MPTPKYKERTPFALCLWIVWLTQFEDPNCCTKCYKLCITNYLEQGTTRYVLQGTTN